MDSFGEIRMPKILRSAKGESCTLRAPCCNRDTETTVFAHSNEPEHGKAQGRKADDIFGFYACSECHRVYDEGRLIDYYQNKIMMRERVFIAIFRTWRRLIQKGVLK